MESSVWLSEKAKQILAINPDLVSPLRGRWRSSLLE